MSGSSSQSESEKMVIIVESVMGNTYPISMSGSERVSVIKSRLFLRTDIPVVRQRLVYRNEELKDFYTLSDYSIMDGSVVKLLFAMRGGPVTSRRRSFVLDKTFLSIQNSLERGRTPIVIVKNNGVNGFIQLMSNKRLNGNKMGPIYDDDDTDDDDNDDDNDDGDSDINDDDFFKFENHDEENVNSITVQTVKNAKSLSCTGANGNYTLDSGAYSHNSLERGRIPIAIVKNNGVNGFIQLMSDKRLNDNKMGTIYDDGDNNNGGGNFFEFEKEEKLNNACYNRGGENVNTRPVQTVKNVKTLSFGARNGNYANDSNTYSQKEAFCECEKRGFTGFDEYEKKISFLKTHSKGNLENLHVDEDIVSSIVAEFGCVNEEVLQPLILRIKRSEADSVLKPEVSSVPSVISRIGIPKRKNSLDIMFDCYCNNFLQKEMIFNRIKTNNSSKEQNIINLFRPQVTFSLLTNSLMSDRKTPIYGNDKKNCSHSNEMKSINSMKMFEMSSKPLRSDKQSISTKKQQPTKVDCDIVKLPGIKYGQMYLTIVVNVLGAAKNNIKGVLVEKTVSASKSSATGGKSSRKSHTKSSDKSSSVRQQQQPQQQQQRDNNEDRLNNRLDYFPPIHATPSPISRAAVMKQDPHINKNDCTDEKANSTSDDNKQAAVNVSTAANSRDHENRKSPKARCSQCNRKLKIYSTYTCHCKLLFCTSHRYPETHTCAFDYKAEGRKIIEKNNPVIIAEKLPKI